MVILYPFVDGRDGYEMPLTDEQWAELGEALRKVHAAELPPGLMAGIRRETYGPTWREMVRAAVGSAEEVAFEEPAAADLAGFLKARRGEILDLVARAERLGRMLQDEARPVVLCHGDIHAGNLLIASEKSFYVVDWDDPILAPKERDLMFIGGGLMGGWRAPAEEEAHFYRGYGRAEIDPVALAYYRYERICEDIAIYCRQILLTDEGGKDRAQSLRYLRSNFMPEGTIEIAYRSDRTAGEAWMEGWDGEPGG